jgi:hypothetical protein
MLFNFFWGAFLAVVSTGIAYLILYFGSKAIKKKFSDNILKKVFSVLWISIFVVLLKTPITSGLKRSLRDLVSTKTRYEKIAGIMIDEVAQSNPRFREELIAVKNPSNYTRTLTSKGLKRINDQDLLDRGKLLLAISKVGGEQICSGFMTGIMDEKVLFEALEKLPDEDLNGFILIVKKALLAELNQTPFFIVSEKDFKIIIDKYLSLLPEHEGQKLWEVFNLISEKKPVTLKDGCDGTMIFYGNLNKLSKSDAGNLLRYLNSEN